jgi:purine-nucleoside phosphorylase
MASPAQDAANILRARSNFGAPETAIILPSAFAAIAEIAENPVRVPYADLPGFPQTPATADGEVLICAIEGVPALMLKGRADFCEIGDPSLMACPIESVSILGVRSLLSTTGAASTNIDLLPGSLVAISDHIDFKGLNPLIGAGGEANFVNMSEAYDKRVLRRLKTASAACGVAFHERIFMWFSGPSSETPAEARVARMLGADILGISLPPEAILARRYAIPFAGLALVTELAAGVTRTTQKAEPTQLQKATGLVALKRLLRAYVKNR